MKNYIIRAIVFSFLFLCAHQNDLFSQNSSKSGDLHQQEMILYDVDAGTTIGVNNAESIEEQQPVPLNSVTLIQFAGRELKKGIELTWDVEKQGLNMYYTIERSNGFAPWKTIRDIPNDPQKRHYILVDPLPDVGINHYRLSQTNEDGSYEYLSLASINYQSTDHVSITAFDGYLMVQSFESMEIHEIAIYDLRGHKHYVDLVYMGKGDQFQINLSHIPKGIYIAKVEYPMGHFSKKIILADEKEVGILF